MVACFIDVSFLVILNVTSKIHVEIHFSYKIDEHYNLHSYFQRLFKISRISSINNKLLESKKNKLFT